MATKWERKSSSHVGVLAVRISGTIEATIGIIRIDDNVTARETGGQSSTTDHGAYEDHLGR